MPSPCTEELWSYLIGLAPVGEEFWLDREQASEDLGFSSSNVISKYLQNLKYEKAIRQVGSKSFVVTRRLEGA